MKRQTGQTYYLSPSRVHAFAGNSIPALPAALLQAVQAPQLVNAR